MSNPNWRFPARNGGIDYVNDPSSAHFSDAPIPKLVRELIQNSLDAKHDGFTTPVTVTFSETEIQRRLIGGAALRRHLQACLKRAQADDRSDMAEVYSTALNLIKQRSIPCLKVQDTGTIGLNDARWKALVLQEGAVSKSGGAPGGSFGIGKNAILNVSDIQTVFYSTRLVEGRRGRIEKLQGKATLTGHSDPSGSGEDLQHIGFYADADGNPQTTRDIPEFYRLEETGTAVFIMGFNPHSSDWVAQVTRAVIENFFYAIHNLSLIVKVRPKNGQSVHVDHQTIDQLFSDLAPINRSAVHYYRAIRELEDVDVELTKRFNQVRKLRLYVRFEQGSPRRIAHINRNGMLITDSREQKTNPLAPRGRSLWPDYVGVVVPDSDAGDLWLRKMENPSHDSLSSGHLPNEDRRNQADRRFRQVRKELGAIIDRRSDIASYGGGSNVDELASVLPDTEDGAGSRILTTRVIDSQTPSYSTIEMEEDTEVRGDGDGESLAAGSGAGGKGEEGSGIGEDGDNPVSRPVRSSTLRRVRYIPLSDTEAIIAFNATSDPPREVRLSLAPAGADPDPRRNKPVAIIEATMLGEEETPLQVRDGQVTFMPQSTERVTVKVVADGNLGQGAFRLR